ncbi:MAG: hypothetical protein K6G00_10230 [Treponema sp.]|nr:hypothetical protein [Treponema sp.]
MKNKKTSIAGFIFAFIYGLTIAGFLFSLKQEIDKGNETAQDRFAILTRETSQNLNVNEIGTEAFYDSFLESLGNLSDIAGVQLKYNNSLIFSYPADIANGIITRSKHAKLSSTNINTKDNEMLTLSAAIYKLKPTVFQRNLKITFVIILAATLICLSYIIYLSLYDSSKKEKTSSKKVDDKEDEEYDDDYDEEDEEYDDDYDEEDDFLDDDNEEINHDEEIKKDNELNEVAEDEKTENETYIIEEQESNENPEQQESSVKESLKNNLSEEDNDSELFEDEDDINLEEDDLTLGDDDISLDEDEELFTDEDNKADENIENEEQNESDDENPYTKIQISPAEYSALQEAIDETQAELEAETNFEEKEDSDLFKDFDEESEELEKSKNQDDLEKSEDYKNQDDSKNSEQTQLTSMHPKGLFSEKTGFGWEAYMITRLDSELLRAASSEQDLSLFTIRIQDLTWFTDEGKEIADFIKTVVNFPDLIFEYETDGCTAILPNTHIDQSLKTADDLYTGITEILQQYGNSNKIGIGISAKSLRMISGERLANESQEALRHAFQDETSPIVAFKVNPQKYRNYLAAQAEDSQES